MAEFKGTKGKWEAKNLFNNWIITDNKDNVLNIRDNEANAKLMAAAPELLEALQYYFDVLEEVRGENWKEKPDHVLSKMINAVKKATE